MGTQKSMGRGQQLILGTNQSGNVDTTDIMDRGEEVAGGGIVQFSGTAGTTVDVSVLGSLDGTNWYTIGVADPSTPTTFAVKKTYTTTQTAAFLMWSRDVPYRYLKVNYAANTGFTAMQSIVYPAGGVEVLP